MTSTLSTSPPDVAADAAEAGPSSEVAEVRFRAMGSDAQVIVVGGRPELVDDARRRIDELEASWSRFLPDSDLNSLNAHPGEWVRVGRDLATVIEHARAAWALTGGGFDPTVLGAVKAAGYDRSFELLGDTDHEPPSGLRPAAEFAPERCLIGCDEIELRAPTVTERRPAGHPPTTTPTPMPVASDGDVMARIPDGCGIDLGGIGKGLAADLVVADLIAAGADGALVNLGGDLRVEGRSPDGPGWRIDIDHPHLHAPLGTLVLHRGGVATSTTLKRRWRTRRGTTAHHLIDPTTRSPYDGDVELSVVVSGAAWRAEVLAKAGLLRGTGRCFDLIDDRIDVAMVVDRRGLVSTSANFTNFVSGQLPAALPEPNTSNDWSRT
ncbi:MAG: FAD:protein FMN transferase [Microthrixaceae bacterium]